MRNFSFVAALLALLLLGGCATSSGPRLGSELAGRSARLTPVRGQPSTLYFSPNGVVRSVFGRKSATGRWWVRGRRLCFQWGGTRECWPYRAPLQRGEIRTIRSDRGNLVRVRLN